jgi:hypothetical protein
MFNCEDVINTIDADPCTTKSLVTINEPDTVTFCLSVLTNDAVLEKLELTAFNTYDAVCAVVIKEAVDALLEKLELTALRTYDAVTALSAREAETDLEADVANEADTAFNT